MFTFPRRITNATLVAVLVLGTFAPLSAHAASSWNPTLLVNTEAFQTIDQGNGTSDIELRFGSSTITLKFLYTSQKFQFSKSLSVVGSISGSSLTIDGVSSFSGASTFKNTATVKGTLSGQSLRISGGGADVQGALNASGAIRTDSNITINDDADTNDGILTFGNSTANQTLKYLNASQRFQISKSLSVVGSISGSSLTIDGTSSFSGASTFKNNVFVRGTLSGSKLSIDGNSTLSGSLLVKSNIAAKGTVSGATIGGFGLGSCNGANQKLIFNTTTNKFECGTDQNAAWSNTGSLQTRFDNRYVNTSGDTMTGTLTINNSAGLNASGSILTNTNITLNSDNGATDAVLTFGNSTASQTLKFLNASQIFEFTKGIRVLGTISGSALRIDGNATIGGPLTVTGAIKTKGNLSGSTLTVDGGFNLHGVAYTIQGSQGGASTFLKNDGAGALTWASTSVGNGSGGIISLHPEYTNSIYFSSGSSFVGQLSASGSAALNENFYHWTTSRSGIQDYWISVRVRLPDNFSSWDPIKPVQLRYRTSNAVATDNHITVRMKDTNNSIQTLTGAMVNNSFTTANMRGPETTGTFTAKNYITVYIKLATLSTGFAEVGFLNLNYETTTP